MIRRLHSPPTVSNRRHMIRRQPIKNKRDTGIFPEFYCMYRSVGYTNSISYIYSNASLSVMLSDQLDEIYFARSLYLLLRVRTYVSLNELATQILFRTYISRISRRVQQFIAVNYRLDRRRYHHRHSPPTCRPLIGCRRFACRAYVCVCVCRRTDREPY
jgi:hypothetical protein